MRPDVYITCGACNEKRGVAAAECKHYNCPWLNDHVYRYNSARQLGAIADRLYQEYDLEGGMNILDEIDRKIFKDIPKSELPKERELTLEQKLRLQMIEDASHVSI